MTSGSLLSGVTLGDMLDPELAGHVTVFSRRVGRTVLHKLCLREVAMETCTV